MAYDCDAVVIGSGIGGLCCASILAQHGMQVWVFEKHFKLGGYTHTFARKPYEWDVGVHYVGEMAPGMRPRAVLDYVTEGHVKWHGLPSTYDHLVFPGWTYGLRAGEGPLRDDLIATFPHERAAIDAYVRDIQVAQNWYRKYLLATLDPTGAHVPELFKGPEPELAMRRTSAYMKERFQDPRLRAVATGQWGDYGVPPSQSAFVAHSNVVSHYRFGGWYPEGGSACLADRMRDVIEQRGGRVLVNHDVREVLVEGGRAVGVRVAGRSREVRGQRDVRAGIVISGVGAYNTYTKLMPQEQAGAARAALESLPQSMAAATAYVGLSKDPRTLGFGGENRWLFSSYDHEATWQRRNELVEGKAHFCYLSFPSLKSDHAQAHTAELMAPVDAAPFARWSAGRWRRRGDDYDAIKRRIGDALVDMVESAYPGFRDCVAFMEVATPLTAQHFTGHKEGAIYGLAGVPERYQSKFARIHTPLAGLLLTGSDAAGHGVVGATMGGLMTASAVLGPASNFIKLLADMDRFSASLRTSAQPMPSALAQAKRLQ